MIRRGTTSSSQKVGRSVTGGAYLVLTLALVATTPDGPSIPASDPLDIDVVAADRDVEVLITEYKIDMSESVAAGEITFVVRNGGTEEHGFKIARDGWDAALEGQLADQAALSGVLDTLYQLHLPVLSVDCLESD